MNQYALRLFVRSILAEAKDKEPKKKEEKAPKSSGKLVDLKKELAALEQYKDELQAAKFAEKTASTEVEFADLAHFAKELAALKERGVELEIRKNRHTGCFLPYLQLFTSKRKTSYTYIR